MNLPTFSHHFYPVFNFRPGGQSGNGPFLVQVNAAVTLAKRQISRREPPEKQAMSPAFSTPISTITVGAVVAGVTQFRDQAAAAFQISRGEVDC